MHQHIACCEECQKRCSELRQTSDLLTETLQRTSLPSLPQDVAWDWLQSPEAAQSAYQRRQHERLHEDMTLGIALLTRLPLVLLTKSVQAVPALLPYGRKLQPEPPGHGIRTLRFAKLMSLPAVVFLLVTLTTILVVAELNIHYPLDPFQSFGSITTKGVQSTVIVPAHPTPTSAVVLQPGVTLTPAGSKPTLTECQQINNKAARSILICGNNFAPNSKIELVFQFGGVLPKARHTVHVDASGNFEELWTIYSCKDVPISVNAQNVTRPIVPLGESLNIQFGKCSSNTLPKISSSHH